MSRISKNFTMGEFAVSGSRPDLVEPVPVSLRANVKALVDNVLQPICDQTGWKCNVTSGYRSLELNRAVGGVPTSQHVQAEAADTQWVDGKGKQLPAINVMIKAVELNLDFDQMIAYPTFVHFSYTKKRKNRRQTLYNRSYKGKRI